MKEVDFRLIFNIGDEGIFFDGGRILFEELIEKDGYFGEERNENGEFEVVLYSKDSYFIKFPFEAFKKDGIATKSARAKMGSFILFLSQKGVKIKTL